MLERCRVLVAVTLAVVVGSLVVLPGVVAAAEATTAVVAQEESPTEDGEGSGEAGAAVRGRIRGPDGPLAGVVVRAIQGGEVAGEATTDDAGDWQIDLPAAGPTTVELDLETLPEGLGVREEQFESQEVEVAAGDNKAVLFPIVADEGAVRGVSTESLQRLLNLVVQGIKVGTIIAIASVGLSLIFGVTGLVNFAHGELVTLGAVVAYYAHVGPGGKRLPLIAAAVVAVIVGGIAGAGLEKGVFLPLRRKKAGLISLLVITIGLSFFIRHIILVVYGGGTQKYIDYAVQTDPVVLGPLRLPPRDVAVIVVSLLVLAGVGLLLQKTKLGTAMRAVADNRDLAESSGIDVKKVILAVWILGGALAGLGGVFQGLTVGGVDWDMGFALLLLMFAGVIVGGIGTAYGAMVGGLLVGLVSEVSTFWFSVELKLVFAFLVLIVVLLFRPQGLLGRAERIG